MGRTGRQNALAATAATRLAIGRPGFSAEKYLASDSWSTQAGIRIVAVPHLRHIGVLEFDDQRGDLRMADRP